MLRPLPHLLAVDVLISKPQVEEPAGLCLEKLTQSKLLPCGYAPPHAGALCLVGLSYLLHCQGCDKYKPDVGINACTETRGEHRRGDWRGLRSKRIAAI